MSLRARQRSDPCRWLLRVREAGECRDGYRTGNVAMSAPGDLRRDAGWLRAALARALAWASLAWMGAEGAVGLWQGFASGSVALTGWALGSAVEGLASVIVIWRFTDRARCPGPQSGVPSAL